MYSDKIMQIFARPKNVGIIKNAESVGEAGDVNGADYIKMFLRIEDTEIKDAKFKAFGSPFTIACMSILTGMLKGQELSQLNEISGKTVIDYLGELPAGRDYVITLLDELIDSCIRDFLKKQEKLMLEELI